MSDRVEPIPPIIETDLMRLKALVEHWFGEPTADDFQFAVDAVERRESEIAILRDAVMLLLIDAETRPRLPTAAEEQSMRVAREALARTQTRDTPLRQQGAEGEG